MHIALDGREFVAGKQTGIARFLTGLVTALTFDNAVRRIFLCVSNPEFAPEVFQQNDRIRLVDLPNSFLGSELALVSMSKSGVDCLISPYRKLPLFGHRCLWVHTIHDVLDLTHFAYRRHFKIWLEKLRLKAALTRADLTWYDSTFSRKQTRDLVGSTGRNPRVRYLGLGERFSPVGSTEDEAVLAQYNLTGGYVLTVGNGLPHKNLQVLLNAAVHLERRLVFVGVSSKNQSYWEARCPGMASIWLEQIQDEDLPAILRNAFCLAHPSTAEGYGYPPLEAMACGVPAIISDIPVLRETTGDCAVAVNPYDPNSWYEALSHLENKSHYRIQVEKGLKWVKPLQGKQGWEKHLADIKELIGEDR
jgi:glycosyltransferase involved in cell wall biosynthesis